ncbi:unnamed protein product, partial [Cyprideis torosa]
PLSVETLHAILDEIDDENDLPDNNLFLIPPEPGEISDEYSGDEEDVIDLGHLSGRILNAQVEVGEPEEQRPVPEAVPLESSAAEESGDGRRTRRDDRGSRAGYRSHAARKTKNMINMIVEESNFYARKKDNIDLMLARDEAYTFLAILILSGYNPVPRFDLFWDSSEDMGNRAVQNAMRRNRFREIKRYLHFEREVDKSDRYSKVRSVIRRLQKSFLQHYIPGQYLSHDECMVKYFGKSSLKQSIRMKPIRFGFKVWALNDPVGYLVAFEMYQGANFEGDPEIEAQPGEISDEYSGDEEDVIDLGDLSGRILNAQVEVGEPEEQRPVPEAVPVESSAAEESGDVRRTRRDDRGSRVGYRSHAARKTKSRPTENWKKRKTCSRGIQILPERETTKYKDFNPYELFHLFVDEDMINMIVEESNFYARKKDNIDLMLARDEAYTFLAILILSGYNPVPRFDLFWDSSEDMGNRAVQNAMRRNRFREIKRYLHFEREVDKSDRYSKVRSVIRRLQKSFLQHYIPGQYLSHDECMVKYFGKSSLKQSIRMKPIRFGFKVWALNDPVGYLVAFEMYQGANFEGDPEIEAQVGKCSGTVLHLVDQMLAVDKFKDLPFHVMRHLDRRSRFNLHRVRSLLLVGVGLVTGIFATKFVTEWTWTELHQFRDIKEPVDRRTETKARASSCVPQTRIVSSATSASDHWANSLRELQQSSMLPPPVFRGPHQSLCKNTSGRTKRWEYCLPISGLKNEPLCSNPDRMSLLSWNTSSRNQGIMRNKPCFASVLHMLLMDVYSQLRTFKGNPALLYGTLLGAIRNGLIIPYTQDVDLGYERENERGFSIAAVREALSNVGYHMFNAANLWRVCVAPTHPLAFVLYDQTLPVISGPYQVPYVDLYAMNSERHRTEWRAEGSPPIPIKKALPYSQVRINGVEFDTLADPIAHIASSSHRWVQQWCQIFPGYPPQYCQSAAREARWNFVGLGDTDWLLVVSGSRLGTSEPLERAVATTPALRRATCGSWISNRHWRQKLENSAPTEFELQYYTAIILQ